MPPRTGAWLFPSAPGRRTVELIEHAEALGLDEIWLGDEGPARDPLSVLAAAAMRTSRIRLGVGVTNPYVRHPATTALSMMTVHELSGGRAILGLGVGGGLALSPLGISPVHPLATTRQALGTMRAVLRGEHAEGYRPPVGAMTAPDLPLFVGSRSERINRLASSVADGAFVAGLSVSQVPEVVGWARSVRDIPIALYVSAAFEAEDVERARPQMAWTLVDSSDATVALTGHPRAAFQAATRSLEAGDPGPACELMTDDVLRHVLLWGEPHEIGVRLAGLVRAQRTTSIGLCLLQSNIPKALEATAAAFTHMRRELATWSPRVARPDALSW